MKTLLITAFEPFGGESENPSALALELLPETIGGIRLEIADNAGYKPEDEPVVTGGANAHFATLPIKRMVSAMERANVAAAVSNSAGTYVCNSTMYALLDHIAANNMPIQAGFIHVPYIPSQVADKPNVPSMPLEDMVRGLTAAIECIDE